MNSKAGLLNKLFSVRSRGLFEEIPKTALKSYLSGLLIGAEVTEATRRIKDKTLMRLIGDSRLLKLYAKALEFFGWPSKMESENLTARGLACIAMSAELK